MFSAHNIYKFLCIDLPAVCVANFPHIFQGQPNWQKFSHASRHNNIIDFPIFLSLFSIPQMDEKLNEEAKMVM